MGAPSQPLPPPGVFPQKHDTPTGPQAHVLHHRRVAAKAWTSLQDHRHVSRPATSHTVKVLCALSGMQTACRWACCLLTVSHGRQCPAGYVSGAVPESSSVPK